MRTLGMSLVAGVILATGAVSGCNSGAGAPDADTSEPETAVEETAAPVAVDLPPAGEVPTPAASAGAQANAGGDPIRGKGGLEEKCLAKVGEVTRAPIIGTNRIEESEAAIAIYVNVEGAQAPWRCLGDRDGALGEVMYSGDEGAL